MKEKDMVSTTAYVKAALEKLGLPVKDDDNFKNTARRWVKYIQHYTQPYNPEDDLKTTFQPKAAAGTRYDRPMVVQVGIPYRAMCAHHLLPVLGTAHVGYIPSDKVVGLSKLARLVYGISHRMPSLQEDVCHEITHALYTHLNAKGAMCVISAEHGCMSARGVEEATGCIHTVTASVKGLFEDKHEVRAEFYEAVRFRGSS